MTGSADHPAPGGAPAPRPPGGRLAQDREVLEDYFREHRHRYTAESLARTAEAAGYAPEDVANARRRTELEASVPADSSRYTTLARVIVVALYVGTFLALTIPTDMERSTYGLGPIILGALLLLTGLVAFVRVGRRRPVPDNTALALASMLAVPFVILVIIAGACIWSTGPVFTGGEPA